jgi:hypothetical protein
MNVFHVVWQIIEEIALDKDDHPDLAFDPCHVTVAGLLHVDARERIAALPESIAALTLFCWHPMGAAEERATLAVKWEHGSHFIGRRHPGHVV